MVSVLHIIVLGYYLVLLSTIGYLGTSLAVVNVEKIIQECAQPTKEWLDCVARGKTGSAAFICEMETSGIIRRNGQLDTPKFRELYLPNIVPGRENTLDYVVNVSQDCINKAGAIKSAADTEIALEHCTALPLAIELLDDALCNIK